MYKICPKKKAGGGGGVRPPPPTYAPAKGPVFSYREEIGVATKREWGASEVLPLQKGWTEKVLAMLKGGGGGGRGHNKFCGSSKT